LFFPTKKRTSGTGAKTLRRYGQISREESASWLQARPMTNDRQIKQTHNVGTNVEPPCAIVQKFLTTFYAHMVAEEQGYYAERRITYYIHIIRALSY